MKKIVAILGFVLLILLIIIIGLSFFLQRKEKKQTASVTPTPIYGYQNNQSSNNDKESNDSTYTNTNKYYYSDDYFTAEYHPEIDKYVIDKKNDQADQKIDDWIKKNQLPDRDQHPDIYIENSTSKTSSGSADKNKGVVSNGIANLLTDLLVIVKKTADITLTPKPTYKITPTSLPSSVPVPAGNLVYYSQCGGSYDNYPLPDGCTVCRAGCGPTSIAMIVASYKDKNTNPQTMVDYYKQKGQYIGCGGSYYSSAKIVLDSLGLTTTGYKYYGLATVNEVASDMKGYLNGGWTLFALANYCDGGCGHYFWITDIDSGGNVWAYDPFYGRFQAPPFNENSKYPFPKYRIILGVKKP